MSKRRILVCAALGFVMTVLPLLLITLTPQPGGAQGAADRALSVLMGPGVAVSRPLFGVHNLGFFVFAPLLNFVVWTAAAYVAAAMYARLHRSAR